MNDFTYRDGIYQPDIPTKGGTNEQASMANFYNDLAGEDIVYAATARRSHGADDYATLVSPNVRLWAKHFPANRHVATVLDMGCGYGRIPLYLSQDKHFRAAWYYGVDISKIMLRAFLHYRERFGFLSGAECTLICQAAEEPLPLEDNSVDLVISCALFNHLEKSSVRAALHEIGRVMRPSGSVFLDRSFANSWWVAGLYHSQLRGRIPMGLPVNRTRYLSLDEVERLLDNSGIRAKCPSLIVEPYGYAILPAKVKGLSVPFAERINRKVNSLNPPKLLQKLLTTHYVVRSEIPGGSTTG